MALKQKHSRSLKAAITKLGEYLDSKDIQDRLKEEIRKRVGLEADQLFSDLSMAQAFTRDPSDADQGPVADPYPGQDTNDAI